MEETLVKLLTIVNSYSPQHADYQIAKPLLSNLREIGSLSVEQMAERCFVSTASLIRFAKNLGFANYSQFRHVFEMSLSLWVPAKPIEGDYTRVEFEKRLLQLIRNEMAHSINNVHTVLNEELLTHIVDTMDQSDHIYLLEDSILKSCSLDFQQKMFLAGKTIEHHQKWVSSTDIPNNSLRIIPRIQRVNSQSTGSSTEIILTDKRTKTGNLIHDLRILIVEHTPYFATSKEFLINGNHTALITLQYILQILLSAYCIRHKK